MSIELIMGPMFSGKTTELMRVTRRYSVANRNCVIIKYSKDNRYSDGDQVATHDRHTMDAIPASNLSDVEAQVSKYNVIGIDEGQFFKDLFEFCEKMVAEGKIIIIAALDGTFERKPFGRVLELVPIAEKVQKLNAVCMICFQDAPFTRRISAEKELEVIGGANKYISCCRFCFDKPLK